MLESKRRLSLYRAFVDQNGRILSSTIWLRGTSQFCWEGGDLETYPLGGGGRLAVDEDGYDIYAAPVPEGEDLEWLRKELVRIAPGGGVVGWYTLSGGRRAITIG